MLFQPRVIQEPINRAYQRADRPLDTNNFREIRQMDILNVKNMTKEFGGLRAIDSLNLSIETGQILGLIGPNGAGKSTAFNCIAGAFAPTSGEIIFNGERINGYKPWNLCKKGLARTFQIVKPFASKSVLYNVTVASFSTTNSRKIAEEKALAVLEYPEFADKKDILAGNLTIADRKRLEIAKALATEPKLLLLDEVMAGLRPNEVDEMVHIHEKTPGQGDHDLSSSSTSCGQSWPFPIASSSSSSEKKSPKGFRKR